MKSLPSFDRVPPDRNPLSLTPKNSADKPISMIHSSLQSKPSSESTAKLLAMI
jgi:hypothetical protein